MDARVVPIIAELRRGLETLYGPRLIRLVLFGSHARGEAVSGSDIDVLVVLQGDVKVGEEIARTGPLLADLSLAHSEVISCTYVSADRYATEKSPLILNVQREGVSL